jgi:hypothetical protein
MTPVSHGWNAEVVLPRAQSFPDTPENCLSVLLCFACDHTKLKTKTKMKPTRTSSQPTTAPKERGVRSNRWLDSQSGFVRIAAARLDPPRASESSVASFTRPPLTRKPSIRVRRQEPWGEEEKEEEQRRSSDDVCRRAPSACGSGHRRTTRRPEPPRREMAIRKDRSTAAAGRHSSSKLVTLCRPSLLGWRMLLLRGTPKRIGGRA